MGSKITPEHYYQFLEYLYRNHKISGKGVISKSNLRLQIAAYFGSDYRTINKHTQNLCDFGFLWESVENPLYAWQIQPKALKLLQEETKGVRK